MLRFGSLFRHEKLKILGAFTLKVLLALLTIRPCKPWYQKCYIKKNSCSSCFCWTFFNDISRNSNGLKSRRNNKFIMNLKWFSESTYILLLRLFSNFVKFWHLVKIPNFTPLGWQWQDDYIIIIVVKPSFLLL